MDAFYKVFSGKPGEARRLLRIISKGVALKHKEIAERPKTRLLTVCGNTCFFYFEANNRLPRKLNI
jgi:hypothetical protein